MHPLVSIEDLPLLPDSLQDDLAKYQSVLSLDPGQTLGLPNHGSPKQFGELVGFTLGDKKVIVVHPLWDLHKPVGLLADAVAKVEDPSQVQVRYLNTFNLLRRPSWCYQSLNNTQT